jgi:hypothetical protein
MNSIQSSSSKESTHLHESSKRRILPLLIFELELSIELVRAIAHERTEMGHRLQQNVSNLLYYGVAPLALVQRVPQSRVHRDDLVHVPKDLQDEVGSSFLIGDDVVRLSKGIDPGLKRGGGFVRNIYPLRTQKSRTF